MTALSRASSVTDTPLLFYPETQRACAVVSLDFSWSFGKAWMSELPPMCSLLMKMLGTERWFVISCRASWMAEPSSVVFYISRRSLFPNRLHVKMGECGMRSSDS